MYQISYETVYIERSGRKLGTKLQGHKEPLFNKTSDTSSATVCKVYRKDGVTASSLGKKAKLYIKKL